MADAMSFEHLLSRIYQVGRYGKKDVDADIYRELEYAESNYTLDLANIKNKQQRISTKNIDDLAYDYSVQCRKVWRPVTEAISKGISKYGSSFSKEEITALETAIREPNKLTKEYIDNAIDIAEKIFVKHEIYPA